MKRSATKRRRVSKDPGEDRISSLPDHVAHHILTFLTMRDLARLSLVSKKCRELCISTPFLAIDAMKWSKILQNHKRDKFLSFMDRFIARRKGMGLQRISVKWPFKSDCFGEQYCVLAWLHYAISCGKAEMVDLELKFSERRSMRKICFLPPLDGFGNECLMELKLNLHNAYFKLPSLAGFTKLQSLTLSHVALKDDTSFVEWVSSSCKHLKELSLENVHGIKTISINSLARLEHLRIVTPFNASVSDIDVSAEMLENMYLNWQSGCTSLKLFAPKLKMFTCSGFLVSHCCLGAMEDLESFGIYLKPAPLPSSNQNVFDLVRNICVVDYLSLHDQFVQVLFKQGFLDSSVFHSLHSLTIYASSLSDDLVPAIACLLKATPNLESLSIRYHEFVGARVRNPDGTKAGSFTSDYWESQDLKFIDQLECARIDVSDEGMVYNELELIKYLLEHAKVLQRMKIHYWPAPFPSDICKKINDYDKASPTAQLVFST